MTKIRKHSSKRITLRKKYTCEKKVRDHKKKLKKEIRTMKKGGVLKKPISKGVGIPNLYPYKNEMLDQLERKEKLDDEYRLHLLALKKAQKTLPHGTMESYAQSVQAQVLQFETDTAGQLRPEEIRQAELLMESVGELDPNAR